MLKIISLTKNFGKITALDKVDLEIVEGEFFGLLGPNGAGKSTLMNTIIGYHDGDAGQILFNESEVNRRAIKFRNRIGYVPQEISLFKELTAEENLNIFGGLYEIKKQDLKKRIEDVLELVELTERRNSAVKEFSGGMKRRLNIAASLLHDPELILCDEPTVGVDPQSRNAIFDLLQKLNKEGKTIIYTTHYMEEAERLCSRLAIIDNGKIIALGTLSDLIDTLDSKVTLKIKKYREIDEKLPLLENIGVVTESDLNYEIIPNGDYQLNSELFKKIEEIGIPKDLIQMTRASLEDVFLNLTGRSLRD